MNISGKLLAAAGVVVIVGIGYYWWSHPMVYTDPPFPYYPQASVASSTAVKGVSPVVWRIIPTEDDAQGTPHDEVSVTVEGAEYVIGTYLGTCKEIAASGGIDGKGLLAGELSAIQCYWAGSGDEIGVFAHEDGGYQIMVGEIAEPTAESAAFRGNFKIKTDIPL